MIYLIIFNLLVDLFYNDSIGAKYILIIDGELQKEFSIYYVRNHDGKIFCVKQSENPNFKAVQIKEYDTVNRIINYNYFYFPSWTRIIRPDTFSILQGGHDNIKFIFTNNDSSCLLCPITILDNQDTLFKLYFDELYPNIHELGVIFPDLKILPQRIIKGNKMWIRDEVFRDENKIEQLLSIMNDSRFQVVTENDLENDIFGTGIKFSELKEQIRNNPELYGLESPVLTDSLIIIKD